MDDLHRRDLKGICRNRLARRMERRAGLHHRSHARHPRPRRLRRRSVTGLWFETRHRMVSTQRRRSIAGRNRDGTRASSRSLAAALKRFGLLLLQDKKLPSAVGLVTGKHVSGSWWSHPRAHEIFRRLEELDEAIATKLIGGKVTFIHPRLLPALAAVGAARERWQTHGLSPEARKLLARIDREGSVRASGPAA